MDTRHSTTAISAASIAALVRPMRPANGQTSGSRRRGGGNEAQRGRSPAEQRHAQQRHEAAHQQSEPRARTAAIVRARSPPPSLPGRQRDAGRGPGSDRGRSQSRWPRRPPVAASTRAAHRTDPSRRPSDGARPASVAGIEAHGDGELDRPVELDDARDPVCRHALEAQLAAAAVDADRPHTVPTPVIVPPEGAGGAASISPNSRTTETICSSASAGASSRAPSAPRRAPGGPGRPRSRCEVAVGPDLAVLEDPPRPRRLLTALDALLDEQLSGGLRQRPSALRPARRPGRGSSPAPGSAGSPAPAGRTTSPDIPSRP